ncbi:hypothetical protein T440DRAFT_472025 [Plenodomus tracheiphilus IPT5]|uniref:Uncharacterized protein n=1 Tax=Plenodomus tracheiphilus IPT5 TaxID=1408161 RepID=A0A6A7ASW5_9PLEO|nr:hypothetical protein T440DRAFT_472025 [Plenodomus tracheiphilus IPT5]
MRPKTRTWSCELNKEEKDSWARQLCQKASFERARVVLDNDAKFHHTLTLSASSSNSGRWDLGSWDINADDAVDTSSEALHRCLEELLDIIIAIMDDTNQHQESSKAVPEDPNSVYQHQATQTMAFSIPDTREQGVQTTAGRKPDVCSQGMQTRKPDVRPQGMQTIPYQSEDAQNQTTLMTETVVSDTRTEIVLEEFQRQQSLSWSAARKELIPPSVKGITLTVDAGGMSSEDREEMQRQFPDVAITPLTSDAEYEASHWEEQAEAVQLAETAPADFAIVTRSEVPHTSKASMRHSEDSLWDPTSNTVSNIEDGIRRPSILDFADELGLGIANHERATISSMYTALKKKKIPAPYKDISGSENDIETVKYYDRLLNLYILTYKRKEDELAYLILLRFQNAMCPKEREMPPIAMALRAFKFLSPSSPLCEWLAIVYCFIWPTRCHGPYANFQTEFDTVDTGTQAKLLYAVAYYRDPYVYGNDAGVISSWCDVHNHADHTLEQIALCRHLKKETEINESNLSQIEAAEVIKTLEGGFKKIDPEGMSYIRSDNISIETLGQNNKRKALSVEDDAETPVKKKRGRPLGSGNKKKKADKVPGEGGIDTTVKKKRGRPVGSGKKKAPTLLNRSNEDETTPTDSRTENEDGHNSYVSQTNSTLTPSGDRLSRQSSQSVDQDSGYSNIGMHQAALAIAQNSTPRMKIRPPKAPISGRLEERVQTPPRVSDSNQRTSKTNKSGPSSTITPSAQKPIKQPVILDSAAGEQKLDQDNEAPSCKLHSCERKLTKEEVKQGRARCSSCIEQKRRLKKRQQRK